MSTRVHYQPMKMGKPVITMSVTAVMVLAGIMISVAALPEGRPHCLLECSDGSNKSDCTIDTYLYVTAF